jgi:DNA-binding transcriptional regulator YdaS (Cro superfamily)
MKKFLSYLNELSAADRAAFAGRCGTSFDYLRQIGYGNRLCREALAINIERESGRAVTCEELRPDVDWAFIRATTTSN